MDAPLCFCLPCCRLNAALGVKQVTVMPVLSGSVMGMGEASTDPVDPAAKVRLDEEQQQKKRRTAPLPRNEDLLMQELRATQADEDALQQILHASSEPLPIIHEDGPRWQNVSITPMSHHSRQ